MAEIVATKAEAGPTIPRRRRSGRLSGRMVLARGLIGLATLGAAGTAMATDSAAGAVLGAGAGAIIGHSIGGPDAAVAGGIIGAVTGAAIASSHGPRGISVHYGPGYGYAPPPLYAAPPVYYPVAPRGPVYVVPPPVVVFVPNRGHGFWRHHGFDHRGRPLRTWVPMHGPHRHYAPVPRARDFHPGHRGDRRGHGPRW